MGYKHIVIFEYEATATKFFLLYIRLHSSWMALRKNNKLQCTVGNVFSMQPFSILALCPWEGVYGHS